jgi:hypothetical protein
MTGNIQVSIGGTRKRLQDVDDCWVDQQITRRQAQGQLVCVQVHIECDRAIQSLNTPTCGGVPGGSRPPNHLEQRIFDAWERCNLTTSRFDARDVMAFLKQLMRMLE